MTDRLPRFCWMICNRGRGVLAPLVECCAFKYRAMEKAYDGSHIRELIRQQAAETVILSKSDRRISIPFNRELYRQRNRVEHFVGRINKSFRRIATR